MPSDRSSAEQGQRYLKAWSALGSLLQSGLSWSGRERNCAFLNTRGERFADVSGVSGLDHISDSRGLVTADWDLDGDLDLWYSNRTSPRVRFMRNEGTPGSHFVAIRLQGVKCHRDAIGARIELHTAKAGSKPQIQTLRAGDGYLSQSSKWIHFGLGEDTGIERLVIHWPGGSTEELRNVKADARYRITQGSGVAAAWEPPQRTLRLAPSVPSEPAPPSAARLFPHRRLPLPRLEYALESGQVESVAAPPSGFRLLTLWASWCQPCLIELTELAKEDAALRGAGLDVLALNVDDLEHDVAARLGKATATLEKLGIELRGGVATRATVEILDAVQRVLVMIPRPLALPSSFLIDAEGRLAAVYRGRVSRARLRPDLENLNRTRQDPRAVAVPIPGRWFTNPFPPDLLAIPGKLLEISLANEALGYLKTHVAKVGPDGRRAPLPQGLPAPALVDLCSRVGTELRSQGRRDLALEAYRLGLAYGSLDWRLRSRLAATLEEQGQIAEALAEHRRTLELQPDHLPTENSIAWILATSPDPSLRSPQEAIGRAEKVCRATGNRVPSPLDTLAAAYAAAGRFGEAVKTAEKAVELATSANETELADRIRARLQLYEARRAYVETSSEK